MSAAAQPRARRRRLLRRGLVAALPALLVLVAALALLVRHRPFDPAAYAGPRPLPETVARRFAYAEAGTPATLVAERDHEQGSGYRTRFVQLRVTTPGQVDSHLVQLWHYEAEAPGRRPAVVVSPIHGGRILLARLIARSLARRGLHAVVVLKAENYLDGAAEEERLERVLRTAVVDRMRAIDWLCALPAVDPQRIGAVGVSMGGISTALLAAVDRRVRAWVLALAGGDMGDLVLSSDEASLRRYVAERAARGIEADELRRRIRAALVSDPLALAPSCDARRGLVISARFDRAVPARHQERLWETLGRPERWELPTGHYGAALYLPWLLERMGAFLEERLGD